MSGIEIWNGIVREVINPIILLLFAVALVLVLWGGFQLIRSADEEQGRATGKRALTWGIIGLVVMVSVYAILTIALNIIGADLPS